MSKYRRFYDPGSCIFLTIATHQRRPLFAEAQNIYKLRLATAKMKAEMPVNIIAAVVLPDHIHFLWQLPKDDWDYSKRVGRMKALFSKSLGDVGYEAESLSLSRVKHREKGIWQRRFWEHTIRDEADLEAHINYIHYNPVKHGLVACPHQWLSSSFHRWVEQENLSNDWGCVCDGRKAKLPSFNRVGDCE